MKDRFTPKKAAAEKDPADIIAAKQHGLIIENTEGVSEDVKHRVSLNLPTVIFDAVKTRAKTKGLTLTAYLIGLINKEIENV
jgi:predicted DNA binding CopG/RHH family protein